MKNQETRGSADKSKGRKLKGIGQIVNEELARGNRSVKSILAKVHKMRPQAATKAASVYWYANKAGVSLRAAAGQRARKTA
jgi:hypothetical protein